MRLGSAHRDIGDTDGVGAWSDAVTTFWRGALRDPELRSDVLDDVHGGRRAA